MEERILDLLNSIEEEITNVKEGQEELKIQINDINKKIDTVLNQTADLTEFKTTIISELAKMKEIEEVSKINCYEIARLKINK